MNRIPPGLLYLTIYNTTLRPVVAPAPDDEDAEEQAHILFYTARERAVSRDKILRQVGLAKALVNFSSLFDESAPCENVHSQSRRMVTISPEPNFWIHLCVEVAKTPRPVPHAIKAKNPPGKGKVKEPLVSPGLEVMYDYHDGSVHDAALREHMVRGYELFKLTHGSFTSILESVGQTALELQLERFFTVWAWRWDTEEEIDFGEHLGIPLHPLQKSLVPLLEGFVREHLKGIDAVVPFVLDREYVVPSSQLLKAGYPSALVRHICSRIPPPRPRVQPSTAEPSNTKPLPEDSKPPAQLNTDTSEGKDKYSESTVTPSSPKSANPFLNLNMHVNMNVNMPKWSWPEYFTFGKGGSAKSTRTPTPNIVVTPGLDVMSPALVIKDPIAARGDEITKTGDENVSIQDGIKEGEQSGSGEVRGHIDAESLQDAITSENVHTVPPSRASPRPLPSLTLENEFIQDSLPAEHGDHDTEDDNAGLDGQGKDLQIEEGSFGAEQQEPEQPLILVKPPPPFFSATIYLPSPGAPNPTITLKRRVHHITKDGLTLALVAPEDCELDLPIISIKAMNLFRDLDEIIIGEQSKSLEGSVPNVTNLLEPRDRFIIRTAGWLTASSKGGFRSTSEHLYNAQETLHNDPSILEVFSRGQNPQHWHIGRRGRDDVRERESEKGKSERMKMNGHGEEVFMEVARKESTLTDVDNEIVSVLKRFWEY